MANCIRHEIMVNLDRYDLTRSLSSLKGFLQEVWSNAMLSFLFGRPGSSTPTGNIRNLIDNKAEIPVDAVLKNFNFQIKSFNLINGKYENLGNTAYHVVTDGTYTYFLSTQSRSDAYMYTWTTTTFARSVRCIKD